MNVALADGVWRRVYRRTPRRAAAPALFLDRDGVIVEEVNYLHRVADVALISEAAGVIAAANRSGIPVVVITNQAGIGRGYYGWNEFEAVEDAIAGLLRERGAAIDATLASPYHPDGIAPYRIPDHPSRKPQPGMLLDAAELLPLDLRRSWIVGDKVSDLEAGRAAGLCGGLHVLTGHGPRHRDACLGLAAPGFEVRIADTIDGAAELLPSMR